MLLKIDLIIHLGEYVHFLSSHVLDSLLLLTRPADSPEVERERKEIVTALEAEQKNGVPTYVDCFRNNESRNGFRTWTGIMLQGVRRLFLFFLRRVC